MKKSISKITFITTMIISMFMMMTNNADANEIDTITSRVATDAAFPISSQPLHDAIITKYPTIDTNGDGTISQGEANAWTNHIVLPNIGLTGTIDGIQYFTNITWLELWGNQLEGSIPSNIGNMSNLKHLFLQRNNISGSIPSSIGELTSLQQFVLYENNLSGSIPTEVGNMVSLEQFQLQNNKLTGSIPATLGNLPVLDNINLRDNLISGSIPAELGNLPLLKSLQLSNNPLTGEIPTELGNITTLERIVINGTELTGEIPTSILESPNLVTILAQDSPGLTGNLVENIPSNSNINKIDISGTGIIQALPTNPSMDSTNGGIFIYDNLAEELLNTAQDGPVEGLTQQQIDKAQESANYWSEPTKSQWQDNIDKAQNMLDASSNVTDLLNDTKTDVNDDITQTDIDTAKALVTVLPDGQFKTDLQADIDLAEQYLGARDAAKEAVDNLFNSDGTTIKDVTTQTNIDDANALVDALPDSTFKTELLAKIEEAQKQLNERNDAINKVENLFTDGTHTNIKDSVNQNQINVAQAAVDKLPDGALKDELQTLINKAQELLNSKTGLITADKTPVPVSTDTSKITNTGDFINLSTYFVLLSTSIIGLFFVKKRKLNNN
ncbi:MAG: toxin Cry1Ac domain D-VI-related protein [Coprobacillaceae bacterium]